MSTSPSSTAPPARSIHIEPIHAALLALLLALVLVGAVASDRFATLGNFNNVMEQAASLGLVALGQMLVILAGGIDLSVGGVISLTSVLLAGLVQGDESALWPVVLGVLALGAVIGLGNGLLIIWLRVNPLIVTLGTASMLQGAALLYRQQPGGSVPAYFADLSYAQWGPLSASALFMLLSYALVFVLLAHTRLGRRIYAVGSDSRAAHLSGVALKRVTCFAYAASGFFAALAGVYLVSRMGVGDPRAGFGLELASITPVVIGGTLLRGGRGGVLGTLLGVWLLSLLNNLLNFLDVSSYYQWIIQGLIIVIAVSVFSRREQRGKRLA